MKDRIPTYPGRVRLVPVAGQENLYDMTWADQPLQAGTALDKSALLTDGVAAAFGLTDSAVPNDVLGILSKAVLYDQGVMRTVGGAEVGGKVQSGTFSGTGVSGASNPHSTLTFNFTPKVVILQCPDVRYEDVVYFWGATQWDAVYFKSSANADYPNNASVSGNTMEWYYPDYDNTPDRQFNTSGKVYRYLAIG